MRRLRAIVLFAVATSAAGCFQMQTVVRVNADGSGTIVLRELFSTSAIGQLKQLAGASGRTDADPLSEEQAKSWASSLAAGVTYVSSKPIKVDQFEGREATYSFPNINDLRLSPQPPGPGGLPIPSDTSDAAKVRFALTRQPGGNAMLRLTMPGQFQMPVGGAAAGGGAQTNPLNAIQPAQLAMVKQMLAGARVSVAIEPAGRLIRANTPHVEGSRVTLVEIDLDQLLSDEAALGRLQAAQTPEEARALVKDIKGLKIPLEPEITIEFAPQ